MRISRKRLLYGLACIAMSVSNAHADDNMSLKSEKRFRDYVVRVYDANDLNSAANNSCVEISQQAKKIFSKCGNQFAIGSLYTDENNIGTNITGNGIPNLVISEYTGGAHCCLILHVFEIGEKFSPVQSMDLQNSTDAYFSNLDRDPALELAINDWSFAYWKTSFADSPAPRVILKYRDGKYRPAPALMKLPASAQSQLEKEALAIASLPQWQDQKLQIPSDLWRTMLDLIYSGNVKQAWHFFDVAWPNNIEGKKEFLAEFRKQLETSPYWHDIQAMNP
ncbi:MAG TPA: hypothetical protein PLF22_06335 [Pseudomonadales bacterium]|nr:hypothetical protein [Pseudomonadales bacterium]